MSEIAGVGFFQQADAGVAAKLEGDLAVAGVHGDDAGGAVLEEAVGEASGGGADVEANFSGDVDLPVGECVFEFEAAAAYVFQVFAEKADFGVGIY